MIAQSVRELSSDKQTNKQMKMQSGDCVLAKITDDLSLKIFPIVFPYLPCVNEPILNIMKYLK